MTQNPFESPQAQLDPGPYGQMAGAAQGRDTFDLGEAISTGFSSVTANPVAAIVGMLAAMIVMVLSAFTFVGIFIVGPVVAYGMVRLFLNLHDGGGEVGDVFSGFQTFGAALGAFFLLGLVFFALQIPGYIFQFAAVAAESSILGMVGQVVSLAIGLGVTVRLYFAPMFIVDQGMATMDAVKASWAATDAQKGGIILLALVAGLIGMAGIIALGIGLLFTIPVSYAIFTAAYRQMYPA